jgi:4'-phosphopantetheinyl transferase
MTQAADLVVRLRRTAGDERRATRALLASTAAWCASAPPGSVTLGRTASGAPLLGGGAAGLHASLSHTGGMIAVAVSRRGPVGIDVEAVRPLPALALSKRWFAPEETEWLLGLPEDRAGVGFLLLWTGKEAVAKLYGTGLRGGVLLRQRIAPPLVCDDVPWQPTTDDPGVAVAHRELPGFVLALASGVYSNAQGDPERGPIRSA